MRLTLSKYGGLAAGIRRPAKSVDSQSLGPIDAEKLRQLVEAATTKPSQGKVEGAERARDAMAYEVTIKDDEASAVLAQSDVDMSASFAALVKWIDAHGKVE